MVPYSLGRQGGAGHRGKGRRAIPNAEPLSWRRHAALLPAASCWPCHISQLQESPISKALFDHVLASLAYLFGVSSLGSHTCSSVPLKSSLTPAPPPHRAGICSQQGTCWCVAATTPEELWVGSRGLTHQERAQPTRKGAVVLRTCWPLLLRRPSSVDSWLHTMPSLQSAAKTCWARDYPLWGLMLPW